MKIDLVVAAFVFWKDKTLFVHHRKLDMWLPVGGHIDPNETFDDAIKREIKEETNLDVELLNSSGLEPAAHVKKVLALPFDVNLHSVGDHDHCCVFYLCKALNPEELKFRESELKNVKWFAKDELDQIPLDDYISKQVVRAFDLIEK
ncbi:NUDIX domain-containing protein [Candidatus Woesearchaeota archaeon]|nr:NUDIX domain-containing protein [Candidatus Woesearchaeota archaeon]